MSRVCLPLVIASTLTLSISPTQARDLVVVAIVNTAGSDGSGSNGQGFGSASASCSFDGVSLSCTLSGRTVTATSSDGVVNYNHTIPNTGNYCNESATLSNGHIATWSVALDSGGSSGSTPTTPTNPTPPSTSREVVVAVDFGTEDATNGIPYGEFTWSDSGRVYSQNTSYRERLQVTLTQGKTVNFRCRMHTGSHTWSPEYQGTLTADNTGQYPYYVRLTINDYEFKSEWTRGNCCTSWGDDWVQLNPIPNTTGVFYTISRWQSRNAYTTIAVLPLATGTRTSSPDCGDMSTPESGVYYVRTSGNDSNDGRTMNRAFRTINKAAASVIPGDTVFVGAGTYAENVTFSKGGSADRRVQFIADSTGQNTGDAGEVHLSGNLTMNALRNFTLHGFKLTGSGDFLKWNGGSGNIMSRCDVSGGHNLVSVKNNAALLITGCRIHHGTDDGIDISNSSFVVVEGTTIESNGDDGFDVDSAASVFLVGCTIQNNAKDGIDLNTSSAAITRVVAERCQIIGNRDNGVRLYNAQILLRNSLIAANHASGVRHMPTGTAHCKSSLFLCTIVGNGESGVLNDAGSTYVRNSIVAMNRDFGINQRSVSGELAHSLLYGNRAASSGTITRIGGSNSNPAFVSDTDYRLSEGSPAVDTAIAPWQADFDLTGFTLSALSHDLLGNARPSGTALDMGCYEGEVTVDRVLYVATNGNDANTGTSWAQAYRTLEQACSLAGPNTQIHIRAGTYPETFVLDRSGRGDRPIKFIADTAGAVFIQPKSSTMTTTLTISNSSHIHFDGLTFTDGNYGARGAGVILSGASGIEFANCNFIGLGAAAISNSSVSFNRGEFKRCSIGLLVRDSSSELDGTRFTQCTSEASRLERAIAFTAKSCRIERCLVGTRLVVRTSAAPNAAPAGSAPRWEHCVFDGNGTPVALERAKSQAEIALIGCTFSNSTRYSLELANCDIELSSTWNDSWNLDHAPSFLKAIDGRLTLRDLVLKDYSSYALITQRNVLRLSNVVFRNNLIGLYAAESLDLRATNCQWVGHRVAPNVNQATTAIFLQGKGVFNNCRIDDNQTGIWLQGSTTGDVILNGTTITNSLFRALHLYQCQMRLDSTILSAFDLQGVTHGIYITGGQIEVRDTTIRNARGTGMLVTGGCRFTADGCTFEDNAQARETTSRHAGLLGDGNLSFTVRNCVFQRQSTGYGLATSLATDVTNCTFKSNYIGIAALHCNTPLAVNNCVITANRIGFYGEDSNVAITPLTMSNSLPVDNDYNIYLTKGQYEISDINLRRGIIENLTAVGSSLSVSNSTFTESPVGMVAWSCPFVEAIGCQFSNNSKLGVKLAGRSTLRNCTIENNGTDGGGLLICYTHDSLIDLTGTTIRGHNGYYGYAVGLYACNWTLNNSNLDRWLFRDNYNLLHARDGSNLTIENVTVKNLSQRLGYSYSSNVTLRSVTLRDCGSGWMSWGDASFDVTNCAIHNCKNHYAIYTGYSPTTIDNTSFTGNAKAALYAHYNSRLDVSNSTFTGGKDWAIWSCMNQPSATWDDNNRHKFVNCTISGNTYGLRLVHASNQNLLLKDTDITGNGWYSIMYDTCNLTVNDQATNHWRVANNTNGPVVRYGSVVLENVFSENNNVFGFFAEQGGHATLVNCHSTGSKHGFFQNNANTTLIDRCRFEGRGESNWGWAVYLEGGPIQVRNSIFTKFHQGVLSQVLRGSSPSREFMNNTFAQMLPWANGLKVEAGNVTMRNNILAGNCTSGVAMRCSNGTVTQSHNLLDGFSTPYSGVTPSDSNVLNQARFVNAAGGDFHLAKGSPAINSGTDLSTAFATDMDGETRPAHRVFDIGAYEYSDRDGSVRVLKWIEHK